MTVRLRPLTLAALVACRPPVAEDTTGVDADTGTDPEDLYPVAAALWSVYMGPQFCARPIGDYIVQIQWWSDWSTDLGARHLDDGTGVWLYEDFYSFGQPTPGDDGEVYVSDYRGLLYRFDVASGEVAWRTELPTHSVVEQWAYGTPLVVGDRVFVGSTDSPAATGGTRGGLYAVDKETGEIVFAAEPEGFAAVAGFLASDGEVVIGGDSTLMAVEIASGEVRWRADVPTNFAAGYYTGLNGPAILDDLLIYEANPDGSAYPYLQAIDLQSGEARFSGPSFPFGSVAVANGLAFASGYWPLDPSVPGTLAMQADGSVAWVFETRTEGLTSPSVDETHVYVNDKHRIWAVDQATGEVSWITTRVYGATKCPAYRQGDYLVLTDDVGILVVFDVPEGF